jgi:hypothetical protein
MGVVMCLAAIISLVCIPCRHGHHSHHTPSAQAISWGSTQALSFQMNAGRASESFGARKQTSCLTHGDDSHHRHSPVDHVPKYIIHRRGAGFDLSESFRTGKTPVMSLRHILY